VAVVTLSRRELPGLVEDPDVQVGEGLGVRDRETAPCVAERVCQRTDPVRGLASRRARGQRRKGPICPARAGWPDLYSSASRNSGGR